LVRTPFTQWHEILSQNTRDTKLSYGEKQDSYLTWVCNGTGTRQTDKTQDTKTELPQLIRTIASYASSRT